MNQHEFYVELTRIQEDCNQKVVNLVIKAREEQFGQNDGDESMPYADDPNWQRKADALAELCGWIYDRMHGRNRLHRQSMTKKIRKALGYTYP